MNDLTVELFRQVAKSQMAEGFKQPPEVQQSVVNRYAALPGLRGFWPMSSVDYTAANRGIDLSGQGNHLTANNAPLFGYDGLAPYVQLDGANQYLSRADGGAGNWADILGTEAYIVAAQRGLTTGGWFIFDNAAAANEMMIAKDDSAPNRGYFTRRNAAGTCRFGVSVDGNALTSVDSVATVGASVWTFIVGRFIPSTSLDIFINSTLASNAAAIPASIWDSVADFKIGAVRAVPTFFMDGRGSMCFLCAAQLSDAIILSLYEQTRAIYGV